MGVPDKDEGEDEVDDDDEKRSQRLGMVRTDARAFADEHRVPERRSRATPPFWKGSAAAAAAKVPEGARGMGGSRKDLFIIGLHCWGRGQPVTRLGGEAGKREGAAGKENGCPQRLGS